VDAVKTRTTLEGDAAFEEQVRVNGLSATTLTFTPLNWNIPQIITVSAIDDGVQDGSETRRCSRPLRKREQDPRAAHHRRGGWRLALIRRRR
jgi:hypothetical protein